MIIGIIGSYNLIGISLNGYTRAIDTERTNHSAPQPSSILSTMKISPVILLVIKN